MSDVIESDNGRVIQLKTPKRVIQDKIDAEIMKATIAPPMSDLLNRGRSGGYPHYLFSFNNPNVDRAWTNEILYRTVSWEYACVNFIANSAHNAGYSVVPVKKRSEKKVSTHVQKFVDGLADFFESANEEQSFSEIYKQTHIDLGANGKAYLIVKYLENRPPFKTPIAIYRADYRTIRPIRFHTLAAYFGLPEEYYKGMKNSLIAWVQEVIDSNGIETFLEPIGHTQNSISAMQRNVQLPPWLVYGSNVTYFHPEEVIEIKLDANGTSPLESLEYSLAAEISAQQYTYSYFRNSTKPGIILTMEKGTKDQALVSKQWMQNEFTSPETSYNPMLLLGGIKLVRDSASTQHVQYLDIRKFGIVEVCAANGVDPSIISGEGSASEKEEAKRTCEENTVTPRSKLIFDKITRHFEKVFPSMRGRFKIIPGVKGRSSLHLLNIAQKMVMCGASVNETRALIGLPEMNEEIYNKPQVAVNIMPADLVPEMVKNKSKAVGPAPVKDNNPAGQPGKNTPQGGRGGVYNEQR